MQLGLFDRGASRIDAGFGRRRRLQLGDGAWVDHCPNWLEGHQAVFDALLRRSSWHAHQREMYDRIVKVPRLTASLPQEGTVSQLIEGAGQVLSNLYGRPLPSIALAYYRDGNDSVAPHGDKMAHLVSDTVIAIISVGAPRRFTLRRKGEKRCWAFQLGLGDLLVMGGCCQRDFEHAVPKVRHAEPRISIQFRELLPERDQAAWSRSLRLTEIVRGDDGGLARPLDEVRD